MSKIIEIRKIILQYIAGSVSPDDEKKIEKLEQVLRELALKST